MRILMLGNSFIFTNDLPGLLAGLTGGEVVQHTRGGARLAEQLNSNTRLGAKTQAALRQERWDYVILQEMSNGPLTTPQRFFDSVDKLCRQIRDNGAIPVLFATWAYAPGSEKLAEMGMGYDEMTQRLSEAYHEAARQNQALVADVGVRFFQMEEPLRLYGPDGIHPSLLGTRVAAETIAEVLVDRDICPESGEEGRRQ